MRGSLSSSRLLIVDDEWANVHLLERFFREQGFTNLQTTTDSREALPLFRQFRPDIVLLDLLMPYVDGFSIMVQIGRELMADDYVPILVLTADITNVTKQRALSSGAKDFLTKPVDLTEVLLRVRNLLQTRFLHLEVRQHSEELEQKVWERTRELEETKLEVLERLAIAGEYRDHDTGEHTRRVGNLAAAIAASANAPPGVVRLIHRAAPLHDIGKIGIPDHILRKAGQLRPDEREIMKTHTTIGGKILSGGRHALLQTAKSIALTHHERWDGTGYPAGLAATDIPFEGRVVALADTFDALTQERPYKQAWSADDAIHEILSQSGTQFDPDLVRAFMQLSGNTDLIALSRMVESPTSMALL